jgi:type VI secretion system protein ImpL
MSNRLSHWLGAAGVMLFSVLTAWWLPGLAGIAGARAWVLRGGLLVFGIAAAVLLFLFLARRARARLLYSGDESTDDLRLAFSTAQSRLGAAGTAARMDNLPLTLLLGPTASAKTTLVVQAGLDAELLAGEALRADAVTPTDLANIWYARGTIIVDAAGRMLDDAAQWRRLVHHARPSRVAAALGRGRQAARVAVVCIGCDEFIRPGAAEALAGTARLVRTRLSEAAQQLGIHLPVYVVFTRADRLPGFLDYVRNFTTAEAQQVLGATLPFAAERGGSWAETQTRRLQPAFDRIVHSLALARLDVLPRETDEQARAAAYEFPRELRKIQDLAVQFLVDVCRPSQLGINPLLRGFYFTGVRPVVITDVSAPPAAGPGPAPVAAGATSVFNPGMMQQQPSQPLAAGPGGRRVPQWVFLPRLFPHVVLADETARGITASGSRVNLLRRAAIASAAALCLVFALGATVSFAGNRALVRDATAAVSGAREVGGTPGVVGDEDLARLDSLRHQAERLRGYRSTGRPLRLAWGLYRGADVQPLVRRVYFDQFGRAVWQDTEQRLLYYLRSLPATPDENSEFGRTQDALAAHLLTTSEYARATPDLLTPVLTSHARTLGTDSAVALMQRQFTFFAHELPHGNPYGQPADAALVERTQQFLRAFGREAYYRVLVYEGSNAAPAARYTGPSSIVQNDVVVPGAFTLAGWRHVQAQLDSVDNLFVRYQWIYGSQPPPDKPRREDLARMYVDEYIRRWQGYVATGNVQRFSSVSDAAVKLGMLSAPTSPLLGMLAVASRETALDSTSMVAQAFQPLHATVPPGADARGLTSGVLGYATALNGLSSQMNLLGNAAGAARDHALLQAAAAAADVRREAATIAAGFVMAGDAAITANQVQRLLQQPANFADALISGLPSAELNAAGRAFCAGYQPVTRRFPFNRGAADAAVDDVAAIFLRDSGVLWSFYQDALQGLLTPQGRARPGARVRPEFARFFARAAEFTSAVFRGTDMMVVFDFQPAIPAGASEVVLQVDGDQTSFTPTARASRTFAWEADRARAASLVVNFAGERVTVASGAGPWAVFRLFYAGEWSGSGPYRVEWRVPGRSETVTAQVSFESGVPPVFRPGYVGALSECVSQITN